MNFNFVASDYFDTNVLVDIKTFVDCFPDFQTVWLADEDELKLLLQLMEIPIDAGNDLKTEDFSKYWDLSNYKLPEFNSQQFDKFYRNWIEKSKRENNMGEYGNLVFLQGLSVKWNKLKYRLIIKEGD